MLEQNAVILFYSHAFQLRAHDIGCTVNFREMPNLVHRKFSLRRFISQYFQRSIKIDFFDVFEAIGCGFGCVKYRSAPTIDLRIFDDIGECS